MTNFFRRFQSWSKRSDRAESLAIYSLSRALKRGRNSRIGRLAAFDSLDQTFALASGEFHFVCLPKDREISRTIFADGAFDFAKLQTAISLLGPEFILETIVDVGANIGTICIPAIGRGLAQRAIAIEPEPRNFCALMANIHLNGVAEKIDCHNLAAAPSKGTLQFELSPDNSGDHRVRVKSDPGSTRKLISVQSERLDAIVTMANPSSTLIWMDTQGYEGFVLQGAGNLVDAKIPMVLEFWPFGMDKAGSYPALRDGLSSYKTFYDLGDDPKPMAIAAIDSLYTALKNTERFTDILVM